MKSFRGSSGRKWSYDEIKPLGPPGGFGRPYLGTADDGHQIAVKVISTANRVEPERLLRREIDIGQKLSGVSVEASHLLPVIDATITDDEMLLVMEKADESLEDAVQNRLPLNEVDALPILVSIASGLTELHQASVIHRDLKPGNVLRHDGVWKLADFGIARDADLGTQDPTWVGWGSAPYMAPETWRGESPSFKTDLYSLGCLAHELLAGQKPFAGPEMEDFRRQHLSDPPPRIEECSPALARLVLRLLAKDPAGRHQDARAVEEALLAIQEGAGRERVGPDLASLALEHADERASADATASAELEARSRFDNLRREAADDLFEIFERAAEEARSQVPDIRFTMDPGVPSLVNDDASVEAHVEAEKRVKGEAAVAVGEILISNRRIQDGEVAANIVREPNEDGRYEWFVYRFRAQGALRDYPLGPTGRKHGLKVTDFWKHRKYMLGGATHIFTTKRYPMTLEALTRLFAEALSLGRRDL